MKGIVFALFGKMVEERFGMVTWDEILTRVAPASEGAYTAADTYPDRELFSLVSAASAISGEGVNALMRTFGEYSLEQFAVRYPVFFENVSAKEFLLSVHGIIHLEIRKLFPDTQLPELSFEDPAPDRLVMLYRSPRKLCGFAEGMIKATGNHFGAGIQLAHLRCMTKGDDHCRLELLFDGTNGSN